MAFDGNTACWFPSLPISTTTKPRLRIAKFGEGYEQRLEDGINPNDISWSVVFENREREVILAMEEYLQERKGRAFTFRNPVDSISYKVFCDEWRTDWGFRKWQLVAGAKVAIWYGTLSAEFRKANGAAF